MLVVIEGMTCSGKNTICNLLQKQYPDATVIESMNILGGYKPIIGRMSVNPYAVLMLCASTRQAYLPLIQAKLKLGELVIMNRYTMSNMVYGSMNNIAMSKVLKLDYKMPKPDITIFLDVDLAEITERLHERGEHIDLNDLAKIHAHYQLIYGSMYQDERGLGPILGITNNDMQTTLNNIITEINIGDNNEG